MVTAVIFPFLRAAEAGNLPPLTEAQKNKLRHLSVVTLASKLKVVSLSLRHVFPSFFWGAAALILVHVLHSASLTQYCWSSSSWRMCANWKTWLLRQYMQMYCVEAWINATSAWRSITALGGTSGGRSSAPLPALFRNGKECFRLALAGGEHSPKKRKVPFFLHTHTYLLTLHICLNFFYGRNWMRCRLKNINSCFVASSTLAPHYWLLSTQPNTPYIAFTLSQSWAGSVTLEILIL